MPRFREAESFGGLGAPIRRVLIVLPIAAVLSLLTDDTSACVPYQPCYTSASIANSAANVAGYFAPNSFLTIYGTNLSYVTKAISPSDVGAGRLPWALPGSDVAVLINGVPAYVYYVSPNQVNVLVPQLVPGPATIELENRSIYGPAVQITLSPSAPAMFQLDAINVLATHGNGPPLVTPDSPAKRGEIIVIYATGLGVTSPEPACGTLPELVAPLADFADFEVLLNGSPVDRKLIQYAGDTPGFAGLFQINLELPPDCPPNPEIRIGFPNNLSPAQRYLPVM